MSEDMTVTTLDEAIFRLTNALCWFEVSLLRTLKGEPLDPKQEAPDPRRRDLWATVAEALMTRVMVDGKTPPEAVHDVLNVLRQSPASGGGEHTELNVELFEAIMSSTLPMLLVLSKYATRHATSSREEQNEVADFLRAQAAGSA